MTEQIALTIGLPGQKDAYLAEYLLFVRLYRTRRQAELVVVQHGARRLSVSGSARRRSLVPDACRRMRLMQQFQPIWINLAAQSCLAVGFDIPEYIANADAIGVLRPLETIRILNMEEETRIYQASGSDFCGPVHKTSRKETTPFYLRTPYGFAELYVHWVTLNCREASTVLFSIIKARSVARPSWPALGNLEGKVPWPRLCR